MELHGLNFTDKDVTTMTKKEWEKAIREKINNMADREMEKECKSMKKMRLEKK